MKEHICPAFNATLAKYDDFYRPLANLKNIFAIKWGSI
jgi:hypothetical protein